MHPAHEIVRIDRESPHILLFSMLWAVVRVTGVS